MRLCCKENEISTDEVCEGKAAVSMPGTWSARLRWNNSVVATNNFILVAVPTVKFAVRDLVVTLNVLSNCATPVTTNFVSVSAATVNGWFFVDGANTGDVGVLEFLSPDGALFSRMPMGGIPSVGSWCGSRGLQIAGGGAASRLGIWNMRLRWNGAVVATKSFELSPVKIDQVVMTSYLTDSMQGCPVPQANTAFSTSSVYAGIFFSLSGLSTGDRVETRWESPSGWTYRTESFTPLSGPGSWCFRDWILIAGAGAATLPGEWNAVGLVNGKTVFRMPFTIR